MLEPGSTARPAEQTTQRARVAAIAQFFETLQPADVARLGDFYATNAYFKDPFNEVHDLVSMQKIFSHMFVALDQPRFVITGQLVDGAQSFLTWDFQFSFKNFKQGQWQTVRGGSHLKLGGDGLVEFHRDYWDAAEELYEKLPGVGSVMRWLKRRANS